MIEIPRSLLRQFRAVIRRSGSPLDPQREAPAVRCRTGSAGLALEAVRTEVAIRCQAEGSRPEMSLTFPGSLLAQVEGRKDDPVTLERISETTGRARWAEDGVPRVSEFELVPSDAVPAFPEAPRRFTPMPPQFGPALAEAIRSTARDSVRYALTRVQIRGKDGSLVGTDGRQLLVQNGFSFPWTEDLLVPAIPALTGKELLDQGPIGLGRTKTHVALRQGPWTVLLAIDRDGRFPNLENVIPKVGGPVSRLQFDPADGAAAIQVLTKLPGKGDQPITLELATLPALRFRVDDGPVTEIPLAQSSAAGKPIRLASERRPLLRALQLGFAEIQVKDADSALCCRDARRTYVWMPLDKQSVLPASADVLRVPAPDAEPPQEQRKPAMPNPSTNGHRPDEDRRNPTPPERPSLEELISEAETLRTQLAESAQRAARLVGALKQQRRHSRVLRTAIDSLRELRLGP